MKKSHQIFGAVIVLGACAAISFVALKSMRPKDASESADHWRKLVDELKSVPAGTTMTSSSNGDVTVSGTNPPPGSNQKAEFVIHWERATQAECRGLAERAPTAQGFKSIIINGDGPSASACKVSDNAIDATYE